MTSPSNMPDSARLPPGERRSGDRLARSPDVGAGNRGRLARVHAVARGEPAEQDRLRSRGKRLVGSGRGDRQRDRHRKTSSIGRAGFAPIPATALFLAGRGRHAGCGAGAVCAPAHSKARACRGGIQHAGWADEVDPIGRRIASRSQYGNDNSSPHWRWRAQSLRDARRSPVPCRRDPAHPFDVLLGRQMVRVLGTIFDVLRASDRLTVTVAEGHVRFSERDGSLPTSLVAGDQLVYRPGVGTHLRHVPPAAASAWRSGYLIYTNTSLADVVQDLTILHPQNRDRRRDCGASAILRRPAHRQRRRDAEPAIAASSGAGRVQAGWRCSLANRETQGIIRNPVSIAGRAVAQKTSTRLALALMLSTIGIDAAYAGAFPSASLKNPCPRLWSISRSKANCPSATPAWISARHKRMRFPEPIRQNKPCRCCWPAAASDFASSTQVHRANLQVGQFSTWRAAGSRDTGDRGRHGHQKEGGCFRASLFLHSRTWTADRKRPPAHCDGPHDGCRSADNHQSRHRSGQGYFLRGLTDSIVPGLGESVVGVYLDDVRIGDDEPDPDLELVDVDRIEVLNGPQGTLYGSGSLGGLVRIVTHQPDMDQFGGAASASIAQTKYGGLSNSLDGMVNLPLPDDNAAIRVVGYERRDAGYIDQTRLGISKREHNVGCWRPRGVAMGAEGRMVRDGCPHLSAHLGR